MISLSELKFGGIFIVVVVFVVTLIPAGSGYIQCHYCGVRKLCTLPFDPDYAEQINCSVSW